MIELQNHVQPNSATEARRRTWLRLRRHDVTCGLPRNPGRTTAYLAVKDRVTHRHLVRMKPDRYWINYRLIERD